jgi:hypothetical protein
LALVLDLLALELIANQGASTQAQAASDSGTRARMSNCSPNEPASGSPAERSDTRTLFTRCQRSTSAADKDASHDGRDKNDQQGSLDRFYGEHISSFFQKLTKKPSLQEDFQSKENARGKLLTN